MTARPDLSPASGIALGTLLGALVWALVVLALAGLL